MKTSLSIKNFRVFDDKKASFIHLAPITLLTGCNSSGKSSVAKALLLLKDFFKQIETERLCDCKLDFGNPLAKLGKFDLARNKRSNYGGDMTFTYCVRSKMLNDIIAVSLTFNTDSKDMLNNGWLYNIDLWKREDNGRLVHFFGAYRTTDDSLYIEKLNLSALSNDFMAYVLKTLAKDSKFDALEFSNPKSENDYEELLQTLPNFLSQKEYLDFQHEMNNAEVWETDKNTGKRRVVRSAEYEQWSRLNDTIGYYPPKYKERKWLYLDAVKKGTFIPLPIWDLLDGVEKNRTREVLLSWINNYESQEVIAPELKKDECGEYFYKEEVCTQTYPYKHLFDKVLSDFEQSNHDSLFSYFKELEQNWLSSSAVEPNTLSVATVKSIRDFSVSWCAWGDASTAWADLSLKLNKDWLNNDITFSDYCWFFDHLATLSGLSTPQDINKYFVEVNASPRLVDWGYDEIHDAWQQPAIIEDFREFFGELMMEVLSPTNFKSFEFIGDSSIEIKRLYTREGNDHFGRCLLGYLEACRTPEPNKNSTPTPGNFINKWVKAFGLGDHISIKSTAEGLGVIVKLHKTPKDEGSLLADEGLGVTKLIGTLINVEMAILKSGGKEVTLYIEEPENHLHPKFQSMLAEMFADAYKNYGIHFIVETHSEYMVRKLQTLVARKELTPKEVSLQYFYSPDIEQRPQGEPQVKDIPIREDGILLAPFGPGFLDEADNLVTDILTLKAMS